MPRARAAQEKRRVHGQGWDAPDRCGRAPPVANGQYGVSDRKMPPVADAPRHSAVHNENAAAYKAMGQRRDQAVDPVPGASLLSTTNTCACKRGNKDRQSWTRNPQVRTSSRNSVMDIMARRPRVPRQWRATACTGVNL